MDAFAESLYQPLINLWESPRLHGSLQAAAGFTELSIGSALTFSTSGLAAPLGCALLAHGADHLTAGMRTVITGDHYETATTQLLQKTGMSEQNASFVDSGISMLATMRGAAALKNIQAATLPCFTIPKSAGPAKNITTHNVDIPASSYTNAIRLKNRLIAEEIAGGHAFEKHVVTQAEFSGFITSRKEFQMHIENVVNNFSRMKELQNGRLAYWHQETGTVVVRNPSAVDGGTAFRPKTGLEYFEKRLK